MCCWRKKTGITVDRGHRRRSVVGVVQTRSMGSARNTKTEAAQTAPSPGHSKTQLSARRLIATGFWQDGFMELLDAKLSCLAAAHALALRIEPQFFHGCLDGLLL